jgi:hypothetical protein
MSDGTEAIFVYGPEALSQRAAAKPPPITAREAAMTPQIPERRSPTPPSLSNEERRFADCASKAIGVLDDSISSADAVAEAVVQACRPELDEICHLVERRNSATGFCTSAQLAEAAQDMRPKVAGRILEFRAKERVLGGRGPSSRRPPHPKVLEQ